MKILFITDNFPPEVNAPATRTYEHCREWVKAGHEVTVFTCAPNFPGGVVFEGYSNRLKSEETMDGIRVVRLWTYITANKGFVRRTLDYMSFAVISSIFGLFQKTDVIIATSPQFFTTWAASFLSLLKRKPWIFELRDLWPASIATVGALERGKIYRLLEKIELFLYKNSTVVIANSPAFKKNLVKRGIAPGKIYIVPNGANQKLFRPQKKNQALADKYQLNGKFVYGYIGTHGLAHSLDFIIRSISKIDRTDIHFLFVGDGAKKGHMVRLAEELNCSNVTFLDPVPKEKIPDLLSMTDAALVPLKKSDTFKTVIPSKIFEACAMEKPILLGVDGQAREILNEFNAGIYFEPENEQSFIENATRLADDKELYKELSANSIKLANEYDRKRMAKKMLDVIIGNGKLKDNGTK